MQTFLPYECYRKSARVLDRQRLGKQRVETLQILNTLTGRSEGWSEHPAVKMWRGYEYQLSEYGLCICEEWRYRGYKDTCFQKIMRIQQEIQADRTASRDKPWWLGDPDFHKSHRSALLFKDYDFYQPQFDATPDDIAYDYLWPTIVEVYGTRRRVLKGSNGISHEIIGDGITAQWAV